MKIWPFVILLALVLGGGFRKRLGILGEARVERKGLRDFPNQVGTGNKRAATKSLITKRSRCCGPATTAARLSPARTAAR